MKKIVIILGLSLPFMKGAYGQWQSNTNINTPV